MLSRATCDASEFRLSHSFIGHGLIWTRGMLLFSETVRADYAYLKKSMIGKPESWKQGVSEPQSFFYGELELGGRTNREDQTDENKNDLDNGVKVGKTMRER